MARTREDALSLAAQVRRARDFDPANFVAFELGAETPGWIRPEFAEQLRRWPEYFDVQQGRVVLNATLRDAQARTAALAQCTRVLAREGFVTGWRDETYAVLAERGGATLFHIERAAMRRFGLTARGANLNAYVGDGVTLRMWIARRSPTKPIDPGLLDNLVGGGVASGYGPWDTLLKECGEEAGIPAELAGNAQPAGKLLSLRQVPEGMHSEILYVYDLALPATFVPANQDGEVSELSLVSVRELLALLEQGEFSVEAGLVALDFLLRHALITPGHPEFDTLSQMLQQ